MTPIVPRVAIFSHSSLPLNYKTSDGYPWLADSFELHRFNNDISPDVIVNNRFNLLVYIGVAKRWIKSQNCTLPRVFVNSPEEITGDLLYAAYSQESLRDPCPLISAFTPTYKTFSRFDRLYSSFKEQSYQNWEWIILDDTPGEENYEYMINAVKGDHRVKIYKSNRNDGLVGSTKRQAASLCNGVYIMEVDHDDELHHLAFDKCISAFKAFPDAGFCYSDAAEIFETGGVVNYGDGFGMHEGKHYPVHYKGRFLNPANTPINASTLRHIVGAPNHFRCWRQDIYHAIGRHNNKFAIVDDYELMVRTFLCTRMIHIPQTLYIQYMNVGGNNTQEPRRLEIQRLVDRTQKYYDKAIHNRILELGGIDWMWNEEWQCADLNMRSPLNLRRSTLAYVYNI